jgi:hypothetical protein
MVAKHSLYHWLKSEADTENKVDRAAQSDKQPVG